MNSFFINKSDANLPKNIFALSKEQALNKFKINETIEKWEKNEFKKGYISLIKLILTRLIICSTIILTSSIVYSLYLISKDITVIGVKQIYDFKDIFRYINIFQFYFSIPTAILCFIYSIISGILYRKRNHVKYKYHTYILFSVVYAYMLLSLITLSICMIPAIFPYFKILAGIYLILICIKRIRYAFYYELCCIFPEAKIHKPKYIIYKKYLIKSFTLLFLLCFILSGFELIGAITLMLPILVPYTLPTTVGILMDFFLKYYYLNKFPEDFRVKSGKNIDDWYGPLSNKAKERNK